MRLEISGLMKPEQETVKLSVTVRIQDEALYKEAVKARAEREKLERRIHEAFEFNERMALEIFHKRKIDPRDRHTRLISTELFDSDHRGELA